MTSSDAQNGRSRRAAASSGDIELRGVGREGSAERVRRRDRRGLGGWQWQWLWQGGSGSGSGCGRVGVTVAVVVAGWQCFVAVGVHSCQHGKINVKRASDHSKCPQMTFPIYIFIYKISKKASHTLKKAPIPNFRPLKMLATTHPAPSDQS
jgi:hypothetical protein